MEVYTDFLQFSRDLCVQNIEIAHLEEYEPNALVKQVSDTLDYFRDGFRSKLHRVYSRIIKLVMETEEQFLRFAIRRCLKLVDTKRYYFSLMLVAAYIQELVFYIGYKKNCHRFTCAAYKCLAAVFKRKFEASFEKNGGWDGLISFCIRLDYFKAGNDTENIPYILTLGNLDHKKRVYKLIKNCDEHNLRFPLSEYELSLVAIDQDLDVDAQRIELSSDSDDSLLEAGQGCKENNDPDQTSESENPEDDPPKVWFDHSPAESEKSTSDGEWDDSDLDQDDNELDQDDFASDFYEDEYQDAELRMKFAEQFNKFKPDYMCGWCNKRCHLYSKYFVKRHTDSMLKKQTDIDENEMQMN